MISNIDSNYNAICKLFNFSKESTADINKKILLKMAKNGEDRPKNKLGYKLSEYTCSTRDCYDEEFTKEITNLRPDWFIDKKKLSYEECKLEVVSLGIEGERQYRKIRKKLKKYKWPGAPYLYYKEWKSWSDFCETKKIEFLNWFDFASDFRKELAKQNKLGEKINSKNYSYFRKENWPKDPYSYYSEFWKGWKYLADDIVCEAYKCKDISLNDLIQEVKICKVTSFKQYRRCYKKHQWPASPHSMYKKEWISFNHFFGKKEKKFLSYKDLVKEVREAKITSMIQYDKYRKENNKKLWHSSPESYDEWTNNFDFFGKKKDYWSKKEISSYKNLKSLEQVVEEIKNNRIETRKDYRKNCKKFGWPANPDDAYADSWKGWDYFFSREEKTELSWNEFALQVKEAKIKGFWDYRNRYKNHKGWPSRPEKKYAKNWTSWMNLLDKNFSKKNSENQHRNKISWEKLINEVKNAGIKDSQEYRRKYKKYGWTSSPQKSYPENWTNWDDFLQRRKLTFAQLKQEVKNNNIKGQVEYRKRYKEFEGWPVTPEIYFKEEWKDWFDFLSKTRDKYHPLKNDK